MGACSGIRVIEFGSMVTAPLAGQLLADFGAEVIKIEPVGGEIMRSIPPIYQGRSAAFGQWNRNKKSVALDLKQASARDIAVGIVSTADVVIANLRPDALQAYGLDYASVSNANPAIIYLSLMGFGASGPYSELSAYDMAIQGLVGLMPTQGGDGPPQPIRSAIADKVAAYSGAMAVLAALVHRSKEGEGQNIDVSMMDAFANFILPEAFYTKTFIDAPPPIQWVKSIYNQFELTDGWVIGFLMTDRHFQSACDTLGISDLRHDTRFADPGKRNIYQPELISAIGRACAHMSVAEFIRIARANDLPFAPVNFLDDFMSDPQAIHNETFVEFEDSTRPELGRMRLLNNFARMSATPVEARSFAPDLGADTEQILRSFGLTSADLDGLQATGAIAGYKPNG